MAKRKSWIMAARKGRSLDEALGSLQRNCSAKPEANQSRIRWRVLTMTFREISFLLLLLCLVPPGPAIAQETQRAVTNADIVNMAKFGVGEQTIILMIQKGAPKFDTSADAIIELKKAGVSDAVLNAMLSAPSSNVGSAEVPERDCAESLDAVLASVGTREKLMAVQSLKWSGTQIVQYGTGDRFPVQHVHFAATVRRPEFEDCVHTRIQLSNFGKGDHYHPTFNAAGA
jgi:hypothetical protein